MNQLRENEFKKLILKIRKPSNVKGRDSVWGSKAIVFSDAGSSLISHLPHMFCQGLWIRQGLEGESKEERESEEK